MTRLNIFYIGSLANAAACESEGIEVPGGTTANGLLDILVEKHPGLGASKSIVHVGVDKREVPGDHVLKDGDEVMLFLPVVGG